MPGKDRCVSEHKTPENLRYTPEHEWVLATTGAVVRVGITDFAQSQLGDIVYAQLPAIGDAVTAGEPLGEVESTKSVSDVYSPVTGVISAINADVDAAPESLNSDPYGAGWLVEIELESEDELEGALANMLDAAGYAEIAVE
jgi:glycine cleavage system H protein